MKFIKSMNAMKRDRLEKYDSDAVKYNFPLEMSLPIIFAIETLSLVACNVKQKTLLFKIKNVVFA